MNKTVERPVIIIGSGGAAGHAPRCTMASFEAAVRLEVDAVHLGVQFTTDHHPVVCRHESLLETAGVAVRPSDCTASELSGFDIGFRSGDEFRGQRVPLLLEVAAALPKHIRIFIEVLEYSPVTSDRLSRLGDVLRRHGGLERAVFISGEEERLVELKRSFPESAVGLLLTGEVRVPADAVRRADYIGCLCVIVDATLLSRELVEVCHRHGMKAFALGVDEENAMQRLASLGVDGFSTDYPDRLRGRAAARAESAAVSVSQVGAQGVLS
jgi:glycerophosphoryl diester phosphodiesterase